MGVGDKQVCSGQPALFGGFDQYFNTQSTKMNAVRLICTGLLLLVATMYSLAQPIKYEIRPDGAFDITGSSVSLTNCYPAINSNSLKPLKIVITAKGSSKTIQYVLLDGILELNFNYQENALVIRPSLKGVKTKIDFVSILREARTTGVHQLYRTATQIMGQGGLHNWPTDKTDLSSCGPLTGLVPELGSTLVISTRDYSKYNAFTNVFPTNRYGGKKLIEVCIATEQLPVAALPAVYFTENESASQAMQCEANAVAQFMHVKNDKKQTYHWCSWYYSYYYLTEKMLSGYLTEFNTLKPRVPIQTVQIDAGYHPHVGDWLEPSEKFPNGLEPSINEIIANNYNAGIWIGPYMIGNRSKTYLAHPDWILRTMDGKPIINMAMYGEGRLWGGMDEEIYTLDTSNPAVMEYLRTVFRTFRKMGITFFKTDFMLYGAVDSHKVKRHTPGKTSLQYQREFFDMIRQEIGPESFWLGCIAPYAPMLGYADGMRVSADISPNWQGGKSMFDESKGAQHINNIWWQNDPDAIILREKYNDMTDEEARSMILWIGMLGGMINTSDLFREIPADRTALFRFIEPSDTKLTATFPFINKPEKLDILVKNYPLRKSVAILFANLTEETVMATYTLKRLTGISAGTCYSWSEKSSETLGIKSDITLTLNPHESKLIYVAPDGNSPKGMNLGGKQ